jgi:hypothetical protein
MQIQIADLRTVCDRLFAHLDELGIETVEVTHDYYWDIPAEHRYSFEQEPPEHTAGQLTDDWSDLRKVLDGSLDPITYDFVDLAAILREIGETIVR